MVGDGPTVLVTDDDEGCRELFELWLSEDHEVWTAPDGEEALSRLSAAVDVVLLDREMPGPSGTTVAEAIAASEYDPYVVMVSSMCVDTDLADVPIDAYVRKPVSEAELRDALAECHARREYETALDEFFALTAKLAVIEADNPREDLADDESYQRLRWLVDEKGAEVDHALSHNRTDWSAAFRAVDAGFQTEATCRRA